MGNKNVALWPNESAIYAGLDAMKMRGETKKKEEFDLGAGQKLSLAISAKNGSVIDLHQDFKTNEIDFKMDFRSGPENWFRVDNQGGHDYLHLHFQSGTRIFDDRILLPENYTVSGLVSHVFDEAGKIILWKFPNFIVENGPGFVGTA